MKILCDYHHTQLFQSHHFLFVKRLGWDLYFPKGIEWWNEGIWALGHNVGLANQFLVSLFQGHNCGHLIVNGDYIANPISLNEFKDVEFDFILSSHPDQVAGFEKAKRLYQPKTIHICQVGNNWNFPVYLPILSASRKAKFVKGAKVCYYHPEFDIVPIKSPPSLTVTNIMNCMDLISKALFEQTERLLPDWTWKQKGFGNRGEACRNVLMEMEQAQFIWQVKPQGDGYGFVAHQAIAHGRPLITRYSDFDGMTISPLLTKETSIDISGKSPEEIVHLISSAERNYEDLSQSCKERFSSEVSFEDDASCVKDFLEHLVS